MFQLPHAMAIPVRMEELVKMVQMVHTPVHVKMVTLEINVRHVSGFYMCTDLLYFFLYCFTLMHPTNHSTIATNGTGSTNSMLFFIILYTDNNSPMGQIMAHYGATNSAVTSRNVGCTLIIS